ncbi:inorganic triphosphatase [Haemophilus sputorum]|uniref:CYTH domain-containing protein n=1 Tax=Haemophilus sputorum TaxID=1078480 RepID=A0ABX9HTQ7_9PAST|nr:CYTH domain-containing protein [Haemophilus sputorum]RDF08631.1 CYTH domain-containing protein [Haemophilus sputorum]RDF12270.1 CYTH domain-containing protein [Haemophilus sputorum]
MAKLAETAEIELKIRLASENVAKMQAWLNSLPNAAHHQVILGNTYYDTPDRFFPHEQMGLRVRTENTRYEMTLKTAGKVVDGVHIRPEYNLPLNEPRPDFAQLNAHFQLGFENATQINAELLPTFSTDFTRHIWLVRYQQSQIEIALDQGNIRNPLGECEICELEFELKTGQLKDILVLIAQMPVMQGIWFSDLSKAQRGYYLGQAVKFSEEIAKILKADSLLKQEALLADYIREYPENSTYLAALNQQLKTEFDWAQMQAYLKSPTYFAQNLARLTQRYAG